MFIYVESAPYAIRGEFKFDNVVESGVEFGNEFIVR